MRCNCCCVNIEWDYIEALNNLPSILWEDYKEVYCTKCAKNKLASWSMCYYKWNYYLYWHPDIRDCPHCWRIEHKRIIEENYMCNRCFASSLNTNPHARYCPSCWTYHRSWLCSPVLNDMKVVWGSWISFSVRKDSKSRDPKGWELLNDEYIKSIGQYQTERELPEWIKSLLKSFYYNHKVFPHYYTREPVEIKWTVKYTNIKIAKIIIEELKKIKFDRDVDIIKWKKVSKYGWYAFNGISSSWKAKRKYIDVMWNIREREESINKFFEDIWKEATNASMYWEFDYVLSSDIEHKRKAFELNDKVGSCQKRHNYDSYARWAYDAITNWCNCPILLYNKWSDEPFARITTRIMYDKEGQEYILIDRLYHSWEFSDTLMKGVVYKWIVEDLKSKWYKVIASNYSAHDESTYAYLASLWMKSDTKIEDLCQPLRRLIGWCGYYCDWGTVVRTGKIDWVNRTTDYLDAAYLL